MLKIIETMTEAVMVIAYISIVLLPLYLRIEFLMVRPSLIYSGLAS